MPSPECPPSVETLLETERVVGYRPCFAAAFGGVACGVLLSQFWFWTRTPTVQARGGWFWKTQKEITRETGLTRRETETARRRLCALGILQEQKRSIPARLYFRLETAILARLLADKNRQDSAAFPPARKRQASMADSAMLDGAILPNKCSQMRQSTSESTAEKTPEKTHEKTPRPARTVLPSAREIPEEQQAVNRRGVARLKAALDAARRADPPLK